MINRSRFISISEPIPYWQYLFQIYCCFSFKSNIVEQIDSYIISTDNTYSRYIVLFLSNPKITYNKFIPIYMSILTNLISAGIMSLYHIRLSGFFYNINRYTRFNVVFLLNSIVSYNKFTPIYSSILTNLNSAGIMALYHRRVDQSFLQHRYTSFDLIVP